MSPWPPKRLPSSAEVLTWSASPAALNLSRCDWTAAAAPARAAKHDNQDVHNCVDALAWQAEDV